jgi:hypothetical protein
VSCRTDPLMRLCPSPRTRRGMGPSAVPFGALLLLSLLLSASHPGHALQ